MISIFFIKLPLFYSVSKCKILNRTTKSFADNGLAVAEVGEFYVPSPGTSDEQRTNVQDKFKGSGSVSSARTEALYRDAIEVLTFLPNFGNRHIVRCFVSLQTRRGCTAGFHG